MKEKSKFEKIVLYKALKLNEEQIVELLYNEYCNKVFSLSDFKSLLEIIGWKISDIFLSSDFETQKTLGKIGGNL